MYFLTIFIRKYDGNIKIGIRNIQVNKSSEDTLRTQNQIFMVLSMYLWFLKDTKRARYTAASDEDALNAYQLVTKYENLKPSLEPSHAFAEAIKIAPKLSKDTIIIVNSCGDAHKDRDILKQRLGKF